MAFVADKVEEAVKKLPYFEDITAKDVAGRAVTKSVEFYQKRIERLLVKLDAQEINFHAGKFELPKLGYVTNWRYGFQVTFRFKGYEGRAETAALPLRTKEIWPEFAKKKDRALAMALYNLGEHLQSELVSEMYRPDAVPLVPYLLADGNKTVTEMVVGGLIKDLPRFTSATPQIASRNGNHDTITVLPEEV